MDVELRKDRIGGSEVGAICGVDPRLTPRNVWARKKFPAFHQRVQTERMFMGQMMERVGIEVYMLRTKREVVPNQQTFTDPAKPFVACTPDALVVGEPRGLEVKNVGPDQWDKYESAVPPYAELQCRYYMAFHEFPAWDLIALIGGSEARIYTFTRDLEYEQAILGTVAAWHRRFIIGDEAPPIDGSDDSARWLQQRFPAHKRPDIQPANVAEIELLTQYAQVRAAEKFLEPRRALLESQIKEAIGDREGLTWDGGKFTWRRTKDSHYTDWESLGVAVLHNFVKDEQERAKVLKDYERTEEGYRKIRFDPVKEGKENA